MIIHTNQNYKLKGIAVVEKVPTDWQIIRGGKGKIVHAFPTQKSIVDFIGLHAGTPLAFDAKSTRNKTSFPLGNIEEHQIDFLKYWKAQLGLAFFLIHFTSHSTTYYLTLDQLLDFMRTETRKSIPLSYFDTACPKVLNRGIYILDYISVLKNKGDGNA
jgi:recombination protein U